jgi:hypothetical protein
MIMTSYNFNGLKDKHNFGPFIQKALIRISELSIREIRITSI